MRSLVGQVESEEWVRWQCQSEPIVDDRRGRIKCVETKVKKKSRNG